MIVRLVFIFFLLISFAVWAGSTVGDGSLSADNRHLDGKQHIPFGDIAALEQGGWVPRIRDLARNPSVKTRETVWDNSPGERGEIGLFTEWQAIYLATRREDLRQNIIDYANRPYPVIPGGKSYSHTPNEYYLPYLLTKEAAILQKMEQIYADYRNWRQQPETAPLVPMTGREYAWNLRNLAYLAKFEAAGLTEKRVYIEALDNTLKRVLAIIKNPTPEAEEFRVFEWNKVSSEYYGWSGWMQSFIGIVINHMVQMGYDEWRPVAEWQFQHLVRRCGDRWPLKACENDHVFYKHLAKQGESARDAARRSTWATTHPYIGSSAAQKHRYDSLSDNVLPDLNEKPRLSFRNRAQYAYAWAALASENGIPGATELRDRLYTAIKNRGDKWDYKNAIDGGGYIKNIKQADIKQADTPRPQLSSLIPPPDTLIKIPGSEIEVLVKKDEFDFCGQIGCFKSYNAFLAWNIGAYDARRKKWWFPAGGGHGDYGGNEVYLYDLNKLSWSRETDPSPLSGPFLRDSDGDGQNDECPSPARGPLSSHVYSSPIILPNTGQVVISVGSGYCGQKNPIGVTQSWLYDPQEKSWRQLSTDRDLTASAVFDKEKNVIFSAYSQNPLRVQEVDINTWQWTPDKGSTTYGYHTVALLDRDNKTLWVTNDNQGLNKSVWNGAKFVPKGKINDQFGNTTRTSKFIQDKKGRLISWDGQDAFQIFTPETGEFEERLIPGYISSNNPHRQARLNNMAYLEEYDVIALINDPRQGVYLVKIK
ncbi:hypothetical protein [Sedimenticola hydrogenitrophicus]|uniref:hypothetical protein n=1 Tax=Sedimenticola hydrogenitrophicus TaxID=2967975 RepID=UPI0023B15FFB|nr:hypothetical protein [Sedimenticola hydrogenitrophicus]